MIRNGRQESPKILSKTTTGAMSSLAALWEYRSSLVTSLSAMARVIQETFPILLPLHLRRSTSKVTLSSHKMFKDLQIARHQIGALLEVYLRADPLQPTVYQIPI